MVVFAIKQSLYYLLLQWWWICHCPWLPNKKVSYPDKVLGMIKKLAVVLVVATSIVQRSVVLRGDKGLIICLIFGFPDTTSSNCFECCMDFR